MSFQQDSIQQSEQFSYRFSAGDFELETWLDKPGTQVLSGGRGGSLKISIAQQDFVLHRYLRGGLVARLLQDRYFWSGSERTRPQLEYQVVSFARQQQLPVPEMVAFYVTRVGLLYRAASISRYLHNQGTLAEFIAKQPLSTEDWFRLGELVEKLHASGICHVDLNANNILLDFDMQFHFIDFDKARLNPDGQQWKKDNLDRLKRSLDKFQALLATENKPFNFKQQHWQALLDGYQSR